MLLDDYIEPFIPDYLDLISDLLAVFIDFFLAGLLFAFILWAIGYAVRTVFDWLNGWASTRE